MSIRRDTIYNLLGSAIPIVVSLITVPIYLGLIGEARYGILAMSWLFLGYFSVFDLGLGRAVSQRIAAADSNATDVHAQIFWTGFTLNAVLGVAGGIMLWVTARYFFGDIFKIDPELRDEVLNLIPGLVLAVPMITISGIFTGSLQGKKCFKDLNSISIINSLLFQIPPLLVAKFWSINLACIVYISLLMRLLILILYYISCRKNVFKQHAWSFDFNVVKNLLHFGGWVTITSIISPLMVIFDRFIIGALLGPKAVSYYTVPLQLAERTGAIPIALSSAISPHLAHLQTNERNELSNKSFQFILKIITPIIIICILCIEPFFAWWISPSFAAESSLTGKILLLGFWINALTTIPYVQLLATGRPDIVAKCNLIEIFPYLFILYFSLKIYGIIGAATVFSSRLYIDFFLLCIFSKTLKSNAYELLKMSFFIIFCFVSSIKLTFLSNEWIGAEIILSIILIATHWELYGNLKKYLILLKSKNEK